MACPPWPKAWPVTKGRTRKQLRRLLGLTGHELGCCRGFRCLMSLQLVTGAGRLSFGLSRSMGCGGEGTWRARRSQEKSGTRAEEPGRRNWQVGGRCCSRNSTRAPPQAPCSPRYLRSHPRRQLPALPRTPAGESLVSGQWRRGGQGSLALGFCSAAAPLTAQWPPRARGRTRIRIPGWHVRPLSLGSTSASCGCSSPST